MIHRNSLVLETLAGYFSKRHCLEGRTGRSLFLLVRLLRAVSVEHEGYLRRRA
jgi:hypothetical protein